MVHFPGLARTRLYIQRAVSRVHRDGFPHSEIPGSKPACGSPGLIAASHVLHRLLAPRHPPYALSSLTIKLTQCVAAHGVNRAMLRPDKFAFPQFALSRAKLVNYTQRAESLRTGRALGRVRTGSAVDRRYVCQQIQLSKSFGTSHWLERLAPGEVFEKFEPK